VRIPLLSFFTGGGFLDIGFEEVGFDIVWTNEANQVFAEMYEYGIAAWRRSTGACDSETRASSRASITDLRAEEVVGQAFEGRSPALFGLIGGPPCADFSRCGKQKGAAGYYGSLTQAFVDMVCDLQPSFFLMENVPALYRSKRHRSFYDKVIAQLEIAAGYITDSTILNALELGAPQDRERLFVLGIHHQLAKELLGSGPTPGSRGWFPWPEDRRYAGARELPWPTTSPFGEEPDRPKGIPIELTVYPLLGDRVEQLPNGNEHFKPRSSKFWERAEGDTRHKSFKRLHRFRYSPTASYGNNEVHLHPWKPRRLSVREALRIQTVPGGYILPPEASLTAKFKLICNGVPCLMARRVAKSIADLMARL